MHRMPVVSPTHVVREITATPFAASRHGTAFPMIRYLLAVATLFGVAVDSDVAARGDAPAGFTVDMLDAELSRWVITDCKVDCDGQVLTLREGNGFVRSTHPYQDFVLELEYRPLKDDQWDSGVYFRCQPPPAGKPWPNRYQINLKQGQEGDLVGMRGLSGNGLVQPGTWNRLRLTVVGHHASLEINGKPAWQTDAIEPLQGFIGFQVEAPLGGAFEIKNVKVTEIGHQSLFNGKTLDGWEGAGQPAEACWKVADGLLVCTGEKGPWLRSAEQYGDFNLRLEYKVRPGGNSGVYVRVPEDGNHHGDKSGVEIQILDDAAERYRKLKPYQYSASIYAVAPATPRVARPAEHWNCLEIDCRGGSYVITHNGIRVVTAEPVTFPDLAVRRTRGYFGLQNHSEEVWFRNIRLGPSLQSPDAARPVTDLLDHPIVGSERPLREVQDFCAQRVARMPRLTSADDWQAYATELRQTVLDRVYFRGEAAAWRAADVRVEWLDTIEAAPDYRIKKLRFEALPGVWVPALLYEPTVLPEKTPVFLNVNGHDATGKAAPYKQIRCINMAKRGILALNVEWFGMGQLRRDGFVHYRMNQLDLCGTSGIAPFVLAMQRGLDILLAHPHADSERVGVAGLSGGGWQTITISALDPRVTLANPVAGYSSFLTRIENFSDLGDSEQTPCDLAAYADYTHFTAMLAPRHALLTFNAKDNCCFASGHALQPLLDAAAPIYRLLGVEQRLLHHVNHDPGTHNFERDNREALYRAIAAAFYHGDSAFSTTEIECEKEVLTAQQLDVTLPEENRDFHMLAMELASSLPRDAQLPTAAEQVAAWQQARAMQLERTIRYHGEYRVAGYRVAEETWRDHRVTYWKLHVGQDWTVPAVEISPPSAKRTVVLCSEQGRTALGAEVQRHVSDGARVIALDPFYWGESRITQRDFLFALLVGSVGERPVGVQASQLGAIARWLSEEREYGPIELAAYGPRASLAVLLATALNRKHVAAAQLRESLGSLKDVLEQNLGINEAPEYFCFGLLEHFDIATLVAIAAPTPVQFVDANPSVRTHVSPLASWYERLGTKFQPVQE